MHAVIAILAALVRRGRDRRGRVPRRVGRRRRARAHVALRRRVPRDRRGARARATTSSPAATPVTTSTACARRRVGRGRRDRAALLRQPLPRARAASSGSTHQTDDAVQDADPRRLPRRVRDARPRRVGRDARPGRHVRVARCASVPELVDDAHFARARRVRRRARTREHGDVPSRSAGCSRAWTATSRPVEVRDATVTDTDALLARRRVSTPTRSRRCARKEWSA